MTKHINSTYWDRVLRQPLGIQVYISQTVLILPLSVCNEIAAGRTYCDSHWALEFIFLGTVLI